MTAALYRASTVDLGAARSLLAEKYGQYTCAVCGRPGQLDTDTPATVMVTLYDQGMGPLVVHLAHPGWTVPGGWS